MVKCIGNKPKPCHDKNSSSPMSSNLGKHKNLISIINKYKQRQIKFAVTSSSIGDCVFGKHNKDYTNLTALTPSKRDQHQCCLKTEELLRFVHTLEKVLPTLTTNDFDTLWQEINKFAGKGIGPVTVYDTALRYSLWKNLPNPIYVYLHSANGPLKGAKAYFNYKGITTVATPCGNINVKSLKSGCRVEISNFPEFVQNGLDAKNIENILCIYSDELSRLNAKTP